MYLSKYLAWEWSAIETGIELVINQQIFTRKRHNSTRYGKALAYTVRLCKWKTGTCLYVYALAIYSHELCSSHYMLIEQIK